MEIVYIRAEEDEAAATSEGGGSSDGPDTDSDNGASNGRAIKLNDLPQILLQVNSKLLIYVDFLSWRLKI